MLPSVGKVVRNVLVTLGKSIHVSKTAFMPTVARLSPLADAFNGLPGPNVADHAIIGVKNGLFQNEHLTKPSGFGELVEEATRQCRMLLQEAVSPNRNRKMVQVLDDMSDTLCRVADLADCVRMLHPDETYRIAASEACQAIGLLVEELNTYSPLYDASVRASDFTWNSGQTVADLQADQIDKRVLQLFIADFELSGVQLQDSIKQAEFVNSAAAALAIGAEFVKASLSPAVLLSEDLSSAGVRDIAPFERLQLQHPISDDPRPAVRATTYRVYYAPITGQEERLFKLMQLRHRMAQSAGFISFADRATLHSLAETSERVGLFLNQLCGLLAPLASHTAHDHLVPLAEAPLGVSQVSGSGPPSSRLCPWDVPHVLGLKRASIMHEELADYFSLGACMEGVGQLASCLFGLRLRVEPTQPGEVWHPSVIKVVVFPDSKSSRSLSGDEPVGIVYCDLLDRPGKPAQDCHYTIQGGRQLPNSRYQIPIITLQLTLSPPDQSSPVPLLSLGQVENLFHEWGHALHSMLARTRYQHVTGTRCSTDLAELPSTLMEQFALDPRVTREYARHWASGKAPTEYELTALQRLAIGRGLGQSVELIQQAAYASFDQVLHSDSPENTLLAVRPPNQHSSTALPASTYLLSGLLHQFGLSDWLICDPQHIGAWPHRFSHLVGYGGRYYAYLMARAGAHLVWRQCFAADPWSSSKGQLYADKLLRLGGELHPSAMLSNLLSECDSTSDDISDRPLSPERLARGLVDHVEENERAASALLTSMQSPGLHQPGHTPRR